MIAGCMLVVMSALSCETNPEAPGPIEPIAGDSVIRTGDPDAVRSDSDSPSSSARSETWPFRARQVRIHPVTHSAVTDGQRSMIEAHVEFFDQFGHSTKSRGQLRFELREIESGDGSAPIAAWVLDLDDLDENSRRFQPVMRTYQFDLSLDRTDVSGKTLNLVLEADVAGRTMSDTIRIRFH